MKLTFILSVLLAVYCQVAPAQSGCPNGQCPLQRPVKAAVGLTTRTAAGVAAICAGRGCLQHMGGNPYSFEGLGMGSTPEQALRGCCYSNSGMLVADQAVVQGRNGKYYACKRYIR